MTTETRAARYVGGRTIDVTPAVVGIDSPGAMQSSWTVPSRILVRLPDEVSLRDAALVEPTAVAVHDVRRGQLAKGERVLVVGGGPIGLLVAWSPARPGARCSSSRSTPTRDGDPRPGRRWGQLCLSLIYGLMTDHDLAGAVAIGAAHGALAMTTPGDTSSATLAEVLALVNGAGARVQR